MKHEDGNLVYSTESGLHCPHCGKPSDQCRCNPSARPGDDDKTVRIELSQKGHKGKTVTLVQGLSMSPDELKDFARQLKKKTGTGGALKAASSKFRATTVKGSVGSWKNWEGR